MATVFVLGALASFLPATAGDMGNCNIKLRHCNTVGNKIPAVEAHNISVGPSIETGLTDNEKYAWEHLLGQALRNSVPVDEITARFARKTVGFLLEGARQMDNSNPDDALLQVFAGDCCNAHNTGYDGPEVNSIDVRCTTPLQSATTTDTHTTTTTATTTNAQPHQGKVGLGANISAIKSVLGLGEDGPELGNIREVWGMITILGQLVERDDARLLKSLGLNVDAVNKRRVLVDATAWLVTEDPVVAKSDSVSTYLYPSLQSW
eukprot:gene19716-21405_t